MEIIDFKGVFQYNHLDTKNTRNTKDFFFFLVA